jgi:hypothetical protein
MLLRKFETKLVERYCRAQTTMLTEEPPWSNSIVLLETENLWKLSITCSPSKKAADLCLIYRRTWKSGPEAKHHRETNERSSTLIGQAKTPSLRQNDGNTVS